MPRALALALLAVSSMSFGQYAGSKPVPDEFSKGFQAITLEDAKAWLGYLAGPECEGRGSGQDGYLKAAAYMAERFKEFGLKPIGDKGTYYQYVPYGRATVKTAFLKYGDALATVAQEQLTITGVLENFSLSGKLIFLHAKGASAKVPGGLAGKIVIAKLDNVSRDFRRDLARSSAAFLQVSELITAPRPTQVFGEIGNPGGRIHPDAAAALMKAAGVTLAEAADGQVTMESSQRDAAFEVTVEGERKDMPNVVGLLEGSDPTLKAEYVGIGAHLDHLGRRGDVVYWGADDDGSGCTALLGIAKAMHVNGLKPKRSILFMAFAGEEMGLVGSRYLADNPMIPLDKMICELQMDMVGRNSDGIQNGDRNRVDKASENVDTMRLVGSKRISTELHDLIIDTNQFVNFRFKYDAEDVYTRSDHYSFASKGIPIAFLFDGFHPDYHQPTDTVDKINFEKLTNAAKLFYLVALRAANRDTAFKKDVSGG